MRLAWRSLPTAASIWPNRLRPAIRRRLTWTTGIWITNGRRSSISYSPLLAHLRSLHGTLERASCRELALCRRRSMVGWRSTGPTRRRPLSAAAAPSETNRRWGGVAWFVVSVGLTALACGAALLLWSMIATRPELWTLGLPIAVAGQITLLLGFVLQLERMGQGHRDAADKLAQVDQQLHHLQRSSTLLSTTHSSAAPGVLRPSRRRGESPDAAGRRQKPARSLGPADVAARALSSAGPRIDGLAPLIARALAPSRC